MSVRRLTSAHLHPVAEPCEDEELEAEAESPDMEPCTELDQGKAPGPTCGFNLTHTESKFAAVFKFFLMLFIFLIFLIINIFLQLCFFIL